MYDKECKVCGREFKSINKYSSCCSLLCLHKKFSNSSFNRVGKCKKCGKEFLKQGRKIYCSQACDPRTFTQKKECVICGKEFDKKRYNHKFCEECGILQRSIRK